MLHNLRLYMALKTPQKLGLLEENRVEAMKGILLAYDSKQQMLYSKLREVIIHEVVSTLAALLTITSR